MFYVKRIVNLYCFLIGFVITNLTRIYLCISEIFKTNVSNLFFDYKITFSIYVLVLWIHKGYCVVKKLVWDVSIKVVWFKKNIYEGLLGGSFELLKEIADELFRNSALLTDAGSDQFISCWGRYHNYMTSRGLWAPGIVHS